MTTYRRVPDWEGRFKIRSEYVEHYWLPTLGPTGWALLRTLDRNFFRMHDHQVHVSDEVLARTVGINQGTLKRVIKRCCDFQVMHQIDDTSYAVPALLRPLSRNQLSRLTDKLVEYHPYFMQESNDAA